MTQADRPTEVIDFSPELAGEFDRLNRAWIEAYFEVVAADERMLGDPERSIVLPGGAIVFVREPVSSKALGTAALINHGDGTGELAKMAVDETCRGRGLGQILGESIIARARDRGMSEIYLETNSRLKPALRLYERLGFEHTELNPDSEFNRANIRMVLKL